MNEEEDYGHVPSANRPESLTIDPKPKTKKEKETNGRKLKGPFSEYGIVDH